MKRLFFRAAAILLAGAPTALGALSVDATWRGEAHDAVGRPLVGVHDVRLRYYVPDGELPLFAERFVSTPFLEGRFDLDLGCGSVLVASPPIGSLEEVFRVFPELEIEIEISDETYGPRVRLQPAGHSMRSRAAFFGPRGGGDPLGRHSKAWDKENGSTAIQAVVLSPEPSPSAISSPGEAMQRNPFLLDMEGPVESLALRDMPPSPPPVRTPTESGKGEEIDINPIRHESIYDEKGNVIGKVDDPPADPLAAASRGAIGPNVTPAPIANFPGMNNISGYYPPDTEGAVGPNHYVQTTNVSYAIYNKDGTVAKAPALTNTIWTALGGDCASNNDGDAIVLFDRTANRWLISQFSVSTAPEKVCLAVSSSADPLGSYYLYSVTTLRFPDYFKLGAWPDPANNAYFMGTNSGYQGQYDVYALDRENMLAGLPARPAQAFQSYLNLQMPADFDGVTLPPAGSPGYFYTLKDGGQSYFGNPSTDRLEVMSFDVDWTTPANSTYGITTTITPAEGLADFTWTVCGFFQSNCLPQPGTSVRIDSASWWPMKRLQYRNFGTHEAMVGNWTVSNAGQAAPRWFELRKSNAAPGGTWLLHQQGTHVPDTTLHRWMGSIAMDGDGNIGFAYSSVNGTAPNYPSIRYTVREESSPLGTLDTEATLFAGTGSQTGSYGRWGDYSSMTVDPTDDCTFWFTSEYLATTGGSPWLTRIGSFKLPTCPSFSMTPPSRTVCEGTDDTTYDIDLGSTYFLGTTNMSVSGCPAGATCTISPNPITFAGGNTGTLTIFGLDSAPPASYVLGVTATDSVDGAKTRVKNVGLAKVANPAAPVPAAPADGTPGVSTTPTLGWGAAAAATSYLVEVSTSPSFSPIVFQATTTGTSQLVTPALANDTLYYWRVTAINSCAQAPSSAAFRFRTLPPGGTTSFCATPGLSIPDGSAAGTTTTQSVSGLGGTITDVDVSLDVTHTWVGDLIFDVRSPGGTPVSVRVFDRPGYTGSGFGCSSDNVDATLEDEAAGGPVENACPPTGGPYTPNNPLSALDGLAPNGTWTLFAADMVGSDAGVVNEWCLLFATPPSPPLAATEVSGAASGLPLLLSKNGANLDLELEDVAALDYNVYVSNSPRNGSNQFEVGTTNGKVVCNVPTTPTGAPAGKLVTTGFDPSVPTDTGVLFILVSADNGVGSTEGILGQDSVPANIVAPQYCND